MKHPKFTMQPASHQIFRTEGKISHLNLSQQKYFYSVYIQINKKLCASTLHNMLSSSSLPTDIYVTLGSLGWQCVCIFIMCSVPYRANENPAKLDGPWTGRIWFFREKSRVAYVSQGGLKGQWRAGPQQGQSKLQPREVTSSTILPLTSLSEPTSMPSNEEGAAGRSVT